MTKQSYQNVTEVLERKKILQQQFENTERETWDLSAKITSLKSKFLEAKQAVISWQDTHKRSKAQRDLTELKASIKSKDRIEAKYNQAMFEMNSIKESLDNIQTELLACQSHVSQSDILEHQQAIDEKEHQLEKFKQLIAEQQQIIIKASQPTDNTLSLLKQREELLVDKALGSDRKKELDQIDQDIEVQADQDQKTLITNEKLLAHAQQTVTGLERRAAVIQDELIRLKQLTSSLLDELAVGLAEEVAKRYKKAADVMAKELINLVVIDNFVADLGKRKDTGLLPKERWFMKIPKLNNMTAEDCLGDSENYFIDTNNNQLIINQELHQFKEDLQLKGIELI